jgi:ribosomal protein S21
MGARVVVREGESVEQALRRLRREVARSRAADKWPRYAGHYAKPSELRHRRAWLRALKRWVAESKARRTMRCT